MSNYGLAKAEANRYRKELQAMMDDISDIDVKVLNKAVNSGVRTAKELTNVSEGGNLVEFYTRDGEHVQFTTAVSRVGGFMRKSWRALPAQKSKGGATKVMVNTAEYASWVNDGHRLVQGGKMKGWVKGQFMLEKSIARVEKVMADEFRKEVEAVKRKHD